MNKTKQDQLIEILSIPSYYGMETLVQEYLINHGEQMNYKVHQDEKGNVYFEKGNLNEGQYFPFVCAHMDTVYNEHHDLIVQNLRKDVRFGKKESNKMKLFAYLPGTNSRTGLGGDDLAGVFICLQMMEKFDNIKAAFFVEEETFCQGSRNCDMDFFDNVGYAIQFDGPTGNWYSKTLSGTKLYSDDFHQEVKPILESYNVTNYSDDPYTDLLPLTEFFDFCCANLPTGYYKWHSNDEYVNVNHVQKGIEIGIDFIKKLGTKKYKQELEFDDDAITFNC